MATGLISKIIVLDIDVKAGRNGFDTLADLGKSILPETPMTHTRSGGVHVWFAYDGKPEIRNSAGTSGLGTALDIRGEGGWVVLPGARSGYTWDPHYNLDTVALRAGPGWLGRKTSTQRSTVPTGRSGQFDPRATLADCADHIRNAADGDKYFTVRREAFIAATLVRDGLVSERLARHEVEAALTVIGRRVDDYAHMLAAYTGAFAEGLAAPARRRAAR
jgi:hypothetical protein